ncbi:MAG TPA: bifunctional DNA primase/polymerase [Nitrososphaeraceae archaeon]
MTNNNPDLKTTFDYACLYARNGFSIIPLWKKSKKPSIVSWKPFKKLHPSKEELEKWFVDSDNNIGLITGRISSIFALDIDGQETYEYFIQKINSLSDTQLAQSIKDTMKIKTGSGNTNFIFQFDRDEFIIDDYDDDDEIPNNVLWKSSSSDQNNHNEIRLKGEGGYIVVPPSIHENGKGYELINAINPILLTRSQIQELIKLFSISNGNTNAILQVIKILKPHYNNGIRNDLILYLSGWLRKLGVSLEAAEQLINELTKDDEEKANRIRTLHETYKKQDLKKIAGYSGLLKLLSYDCTQDDAKEKLTKVKEIIDNQFGTSENNKKEEKIDIILLIKEDYVDLFVDQFNKPYIAIKIKGHVEILGLDSQRFKNWLYRFFTKIMVR